MKTKTNKSVAVNRITTRSRATRSIVESLSAPLITDELLDDVLDTIDDANAVVGAVGAINDAIEELSDIVTDDDHSHVIIVEEEDKDEDYHDHDEDHFHEDDHFNDVFSIEGELEDEEIITESVRNRVAGRTRRVVESKGRSLVKNAKKALSALESVSTIGICPSCGSSTYNPSKTLCPACRGAISIFRAAESVEDLDNSTSIELNDEELLLIDSEGDTVIEYPDTVESELVENTHEIILDDLTTLEVDSGIAMIDSDEDGELDTDVAVLVIDGTPEEVRDLLIEDNPDGMSVESTEIGYRILVDVSSDGAVNEAGEVEVDEEPLIISIEELPTGTLVHSPELGTVSDLADFVRDMLPEDIELNDTDLAEDVEEDVEDEDEDIEGATFDEEELDGPITESAKPRRRIASKVAESLAPAPRVNRVALRRRK